ncbi:MAG: sensor histidine kinase [Sedimentibacter sp.]
MMLASLITYFVMLLLVYKYIAPLFHYALENLQSNWLSLCSLPLLYSLLSYLTNHYNNTIAGWQETAYFRILILAIIYSSYMIILMLFKQTRDHFVLKNEQTILTLQMDSMKQYLSVLENSHEMAVIYRHDLRHHLQYINTCILQSNFQESSKYIKNICSEIQESGVVLYCENNDTNMILSAYVTKAKNKEIKINIDAIIPKSISFATTDLCVILSNGIENAIYACEKIIDSKKKEINLTCHFKKDKMFIQITNPYQGDIEFNNDIPISNVDGHGTGTISIVKIVTKYQGIYSFETKGNIFTLSVIV